MGHGFIGCEHLLLATASTVTPASAVLRDRGVGPERIETEILRIIGRGQTADLLGGLDSEALASIGIDLDAVRTRLEAAFGPDAFTRTVPACRRNRRRAGGKARWPTDAPPVAPPRPRPRRAACRPGAAATPRSPRLRLSVATFRSRRAPRRPGTLPLREAVTLKDNYIGVQHLALALLTMNDGMVPVILSGLGASNTSLRAAILDRYRKAS